jgi:hypothetical protein
MRIHSPLWTHARTSYPYERLRKTELADRVLRLTKSPQAPRYRRECRLPLKGYSAFMRHTDVKYGVWTLVGWGYNHPPNRPTSGWFSIMWYIRWPQICIWTRFSKKKHKWCIMSTNKLHCTKFDNKAKSNTWLLYVCPSKLIYYILYKSTIRRSNRDTTLIHIIKIILAFSSWIYNFNGQDLKILRNMYELIFVDIVSRLTRHVARKRKIKASQAFVKKNTRDLTRHVA